MPDTYAAIYAEILADMKFTLVWKVVQSYSFSFYSLCINWYFFLMIWGVYRQRGLVG